MPKRGFKNVNHIEYQIVSLSSLEAKFDANAVIDFDALYQSKLARNKNLPIKLLANGKLTKKFTIKVNAASQNAIKMVEQAGGKVEVI